ncbi:MAG: lipopolysaccharide kinase InaA family protein [Planctomycetaceae bacterium]|nr:lipopolysaccharide kinase InaA family protein [Planctomycetaceae bacterium]
MTQPQHKTASRRSAGVHYADEAARALLAGHLGVVEDPAAAGWQLVKRNASRCVWRGSVGGQSVYLKQFHARSLGRRLIRALGVSRARREMHFAAALQRAGVEAVPILAWACGGGREWVVSRAVEPASNLDAWHEAKAADRGGSGLGRVEEASAALAGMIARMHRAGIFHQDLHCGNILIKGGQGPVQLVLMDLHRISQGRATRAAMAANLAQLLCDRCDFTTRSQRLRFLKHYLAALGGDGTARGWQMMIERSAARHRRGIRGKRDRRVLKDNAYFARIKLARGWRGHVVLASKRKFPPSVACEATFEADQWKTLLERPESLLEGDVEVLKDSRSSLVVRRSVAMGGREIAMHIKRPRRKQWYKIVIDCFRPSRPVRAFELGHGLLTRRIATALPLAALERRWGPLLLDSILITETVLCPRLNDFFNAHLSVPPSGEQQLTPTQQRQLAQDVLTEMGRLLQRLHDNNYAHRDLKANNMLVHWRGGRCPGIVLVDLDGLRPVRLLTQRRRFQGLMRLNVSLLNCPVVNHAGQLRMLLGYLRRPGSGRINFKPYWRVLEAWSARKLRQQIRSRRITQAALRQRQGDGGRSTLPI